MTKYPVHQYTPTAEESAAILARIPGLGQAHKGCGGGRCQACNKALEDSEVGIRGYASGEELGLCRKCAATVNTEENINYAESLGATIHARAIRTTDTTTPPV